MPRLALPLVALALAVAAARPLPRSRADEGPAYAEYAVAADHPEASAAGAEILAAGGNAADAAAATMLALGVASPHSSGLGGGGFALYYRASDKSLTFLDFRETAPAATTAETYRAKPGDTEEQAAERSQRGGLAIGVPGEPAGIAELVSRFGTLPLSAIVVPAEKLARDGFAVSDNTVRSLGRMKDVAFATTVFGLKPEPRARVRNVALADTLRRFGKEGAPLFYRGKVARDILAATKRAGGLLTPQDLAAYKVVAREPLRGKALGFDWATAPLPSAGGYTILESLLLLERWLPSDAHWRSPERLHALVESWKGSYLDRQAYFGDPDHVKVPMAALTSEARRAARAERYHPALAQPPGAFAVPLPEEPPLARQPDNRGTSHLCVVDREGNVAAVTTTVNLGFGSHVAAAGLWLNDEMDDFAREVGRDNAFGLVGGAPNLPGPGKRPISSMSPTLAFRDGSPVLCIGGSGGSRIPTAVEQVALYALRDGMSPMQALVAPRLHHQAEPPLVDVRDLSPAQIGELTRRGHSVRESPWSAHVQLIRIGASGPSRLMPGSDPHKGGAPAGR
jgi:gamma-glutamyltranspeptidase/glutathione hydrolase